MDLNFNYRLSLLIMRVIDLRLYHRLNTKTEIC